MSKKTLTLATITEANLARCKRWHPGGIDDWSPERWMTATTGELGEAANALKKLWRLEDGLVSINDADRSYATRQEALDKVGEEIADTFIYLNLLACRLGLNLAAEVVKKFNATSERYGFPERIELRDHE